MLKRLTKSLERGGQAVVERSFHWLRLLSDKRRGEPDFLKKLISKASFVFAVSLTSWLGVKLASGFWHSVAVAGLAGGLSFILLRAFVPLTFFIPETIALRGMGLLGASVRTDGGRELMALYLRQHKEWVKEQKDKSLQPNDRIRVICISGLRIFRDPDAPLHQHAISGQLDVLLPKPQQDNPTLAARYATYGHDFKQSRYRSIQDLVREVDDSIEFLKTNKNNRIFNHDELCMWRVELFENHCLVQNYFPNHRGGDSDVSPVFVFEKSADCEFSYYETFSEMFILLSGQH